MGLDNQTLNTHAEQTPAQVDQSDGHRDSIIFPDNDRENDDRCVSNPLVSPSTYVRNAGQRQRAWCT